MTIENRQKLVTPVGDIVFMAITRPLESKYSKKAEYVIKLAFNEADEGVMEFKEAIESINEGKIITKVKNKETGKRESLPAGIFHVGFKSEHKPAIVDATGNTIEDLPFFTADSTGKASVSAVALTEGVYGTALLSSVRITDLDIVESENTFTTGASDFLDQIQKEATAQVAK